MNSERFSLVVAVLFLLTRMSDAGPPNVSFEKIQLTDRYYCDGIDAGDINGDGHVDVVAGPFWYAGPSFKQAHEFYPAVPLPLAASPSNSMFSFVHDFSGDGRLDILVLGRVHKHSAYWYENPGHEDRLWEKHYAFERVRGESPTMIDLDGNGIVDAGDLAVLLAAWGPCTACCPADYNGDGMVDSTDLAVLLASWD